MNGSSLFLAGGEWVRAIINEGARELVLRGRAAGPEVIVIP